MNFEPKYNSSSFRWTEWETSIWAINNPEEVVQLVGPVQKAWATEIAIASASPEMNRVLGINAPVRSIPEGLDSESYNKGIEIIIDKINKKYFKKIKQIEKIKQTLISQAKIKLNAS